jgi:hypothetical protein
MTFDIEAVQNTANLESCKGKALSPLQERMPLPCLFASTSVTQYASIKKAAQPDLPGEKARPDYPILHLS